MLSEVKVNGEIVSGAMVRWEHDDTWGEAIDEIEIDFNSSIHDILSVTFRTGLSVTVKRGFDSPTEEFIFEGILTQVDPESGVIRCTAKGELIEAIKASRTVSFDKDIDTEAGVGSELFKNYITHSGLSYSSASIVSTGTDEILKTVKLVQNDEDDWTIMQKIADDYKYSIRRKPSDGLVYFQPKGYNIYPTTLEVGINIVGNLSWSENMEQLCNYVIGKGATVYDKIEQTFAGPATEFTLSKTPEDTEVRQTNASGAVFTRGQKDVGAVGTDFDYYVDVENKKIIFVGDKSNIWIRYGAQVPMPVVIKNQTSIDTYGGPNKTASKKTFTYNDVKDVNDVERRVRAYINKFSTPFNSTEIRVTDSVIRNQVVQPGDLVSVSDSGNNKILDVFVREVIKTFPHTGDKLIVGDKIWRTEDWQVDIQGQVDKLFNELNKNQDILISFVDLSRTTKYERRYMKRIRKRYPENTLNLAIAGSHRYGIAGKCRAGDSTGTPELLLGITPGKMHHKEYIYDNDFTDGSTTATVDTTNNRIEF